MRPYQEAIVTALSDRREELASELERLVNSSRTTRRDVEQMLAGLLRVIEESCTGDASDIRTMYLETVVRGYVSGGAQPAQIVGSSVEFLTTLALVLERVLEPQHRVEAGRWLAKFYSTYVAQMLGVVFGAVKSAH